MMLHVKYQGPRPRLSDFRQEDFFYVFTSRCKKVSEFDQKMPQSHTAGQPAAHCEEESKNNKSHTNNSK